MREMPMEISRLLKGSYPRFVVAPKSEPLGQQVPVFMFHGMDPVLFETQLAFLKNNHYRTLTLEEFMAFLRGEHRLNGPSVLLTFDDGHKDWYKIAYPLLRSYGFHAVAYIVPVFIRQKPESATWLSWPEVVEMEQSGAFEFESHTARHDRIFVAPNLVDFFHPSYENNQMGLNVPWIDDDGRYTNRLRWGTPIYANASRFAGKLRFLDDITVRRACVEWVDLHGSENFFKKPSWRSELTKRYFRTARKQTEIRYESDQDRQKAILTDLVDARQTLEEKLGRTVRHLCYPWGSGSELAVSLSRKAGYWSNFWVVHKDRNINRPGDYPFYVPRLKDDYILRLPGERRKSLAEVFLIKLCRRARKLNIY